MSQEWIRLADRTRVNDAYVVKLDEANIAIYAGSISTVAEAWQKFGDPEKTKKMHSEQYGEKADWIGFTTVTAIQENNNGVSVCLRREVNGNV